MTVKFDSKGSTLQGAYYEDEVMAVQLEKERLRTDWPS
jgi:hypothetical protein